jgi:transcription elongation factor GreB
LKKQLDRAEVIDPTTRDTDQVFFGATVTYAEPDGKETTISIVGIDEAQPTRGYVSWMSPIARTLTKAREGDAVPLRTPAGVVELDIVTVKYEALETGG